MKTNGDAAIAQLYAAMEASDGKPVDLTVKSADGKISHKTVTPHFCDPMIGGELNFLGMIPRATVIGLLDKSPALNKIKPGDTILAVDGGTDHLQNPTLEQIRSTLSAAGDKELKVSLTVLDPGQSKPRVTEDLTPYHLPDGGGRMGLGIALGCDEMHLVVARTMADSPAAGKIRADQPSPPSTANRSTIGLTSPVIASAKAGQNISITFIPADQDAKPAVARIELRRQDIDLAKQVTLTQYLALGSMVSACTPTIRWWRSNGASSKRAI